eukprot:CAMPEP_0181447170 /NCGR_PEP_ID=MMETSP1110-20121109/26484_1 /TAXON_ID=174948 /ORGANISM="Symbiodinium sp., Strain CCMP421" /LENGTH=157 /DNA_ID=CAMNT_0023571275 /DNA_START=272 /DNA_END=747 /DNA_ORIENTATION=+
MAQFSPRIIAVEPVDVALADKPGRQQAANTAVGVLWRSVPSRLLYANHVQADVGLVTERLGFVSHKRAATCQPLFGLWNSEDGWIDILISLPVDVSGSNIVRLSPPSSRTVTLTSVVDVCAGGRRTDPRPLMQPAGSSAPELSTCPMALFLCQLNKS